MRQSFILPLLFMFPSIALFYRFIPSASH